MQSYTIFVLGGDGIGPEVTREAVRVLEAVAELYDVSLDLRSMEVGEHVFEATGSYMSDSDLSACDRGAGDGASAILFGAVASEPIGMFRSRYDLYANLRPVRIFPELVDVSPLRPEIVNGLDILIVRELSSGLYYGRQRQGRGGEGVGRWASQEMYYSESEARRIVVSAFDQARSRRGKLTFAHKDNAITDVFAVWWDVIQEVIGGYPDVAFDDMYVDNMAAQLCMRPSDFDVILSSNLLGDILSDLCGGLVGSLGLLPSASVNPSTGFALYEPVSGTAPTIAGQNVANPVGAILSAALLCEHTLKNAAAGEVIERAVRMTWREHRTQDLARGLTSASTSEFGSRVVECVYEIGRL